jgi:hypothetical protein
MVVRLRRIARQTVENRGNDLHVVLRQDNRFPLEVVVVDNNCLIAESFCSWAFTGEISNASENASQSSFMTLLLLKRVFRTVR